MSNASIPSDKLDVLAPMSSQVSDQPEKFGQRQYEPGQTFAALGGGGTGTLLVGLAQTLPDGNAWKVPLLVIAPAASVAISNFWIWVLAELKKNREAKRVQSLVETTRDELFKRIKDPTTPSHLKEKYEKDLSTASIKFFCIMAIQNMKLLCLRCT